ncbi:MAG: tRNA uridine-5-carboxymethylaminomethyl(34) synthesis GTPase MnmE [Pseudohongiellaceae bacterium]
MAHQHKDNDTISAIATAPGRGSIGVVRISGPLVPTIAKQMLGVLPEPRHAHLATFHDVDNNTIDSGIALYFPAPNSFTGEDVLELQGHGGMEIGHLLQQRTLELGARNARPGEFSERAFLNNKIDLVQAEAIADLIDAASSQAARSAMRTLQGVFSERVHTLVAELTKLRVQVEATIDFPDEDIEVSSLTKIKDALTTLTSQLAETRQQAAQGVVLKEGLQIVIIGKPNSGKSTLLNALAGTDAAIVTNIPGTTRDLLNADIQLNGLPLRVTDTAGLRPSTDPVEQEGIRRAHAAIEAADRVLLLFDDTDAVPGNTTSASLNSLLVELGLTVDNPTSSHKPNGSSKAAPQTQPDSQPLLAKLSLIRTKIDLIPGCNPSVTHPYSEGPAIPGKANTSAASTNIPADTTTTSIPLLQLSAKTGKGMPLLQEHLIDIAGYQPAQETLFSARSRHLEALDAATTLLASAHAHFKQNKGRNKPSSPHIRLELVADDLRLTQQELGRITGEFTSDDLLGEIFSSFCIGK